MVQDTPMANDHSDTHIFPWICVFLLHSSRCLVSHFNTMSITSVNTQTDVFENTKKKLLRVSSSFHSSRCVEGRRIKKMCVLFFFICFSPKSKLNARRRLTLSTHRDRFTAHHRHRRSCCEIWACVTFMRHMRLVDVVCVELTFFSLRLSRPHLRCVA